MLAKKLEKGSVESTHKELAFERLQRRRGHDLNNMPGV
jgi:hypothetical protein